MAALRVTSHVSDYLPSSKQCRGAILRLLLEKKGYGGPPFIEPRGWSRDVSRCERVLAEGGAHWGIDPTELRRELDSLKANWKKFGQARSRGPGHPTEDKTLRIIVAARFLKTCGQTRAEEMVAKVLEDLRAHIEPESIQRMIAKFKSPRRKEAFQRRVGGELDFEQWADTQARCWLLLLSNDLQPLMDGQTP